MVTQAAKCAALDKCSGTQFVIIQISKTSTFNWRPISYNEAKAILLFLKVRLSSKEEIIPRS